MSPGLQGDWGFVKGGLCLFSAAVHRHMLHRQHVPAWAHVAMSCGIVFMHPCSTGVGADSCSVRGGLCSVTVGGGE